MNILIIGMGMIGGSMAAAIKAHDIGHTVYGYDKNDISNRLALKNNIVDEIIELDNKIKVMDIIIIATPTQAFKEILLSIKDKISSKVIITDTGSSKQHTQKEFKQIFGKLDKRLIPGHPIAGSEQSGVTEADKFLFVRKNWIITPTELNDKKDIEKLTYILSVIGAKVITMTASHHDDVFALTSHLPHYLSFSILNEMSRRENYEELKEHVGSGFGDMVRLGGSDPHMWADIAMTNKQEVLEKIEDFMDELKKITTWIRNDNYDQILNFIEESNKVHKDLNKDK
jgi:prephenate dehydrogenase